MRGDFTFIACDFSLHCSGIAIMRYSAAERKAYVVRKFHIAVGKSVSLGHALALIFDELVTLFTTCDFRFFVREKVVISHFYDGDRLARVSGVADVALWKTLKETFIDYAPSTIKKTVTGYGAATKVVVDRNLTRFVGEMTYETNDESDAVACGITFLLKEGYIDDPNTVCDGQQHD